MHICLFCDKSFTCKSNLNRHITICKAKETKYLEEQLKKQKEQYEKQIEKLEKQIEKLETQLFEIAKQPKTVTNNNGNTSTHTTNRILNITNNLVPIDESDKWIWEILDMHYTEEVFMGGPNSIGEMTNRHIFRDSKTGKFRIVCTDTSRNVYYYLNCDETLIKDIGMEKFKNIIQRPLSRKTSSHYLKIIEKEPEDEERNGEIFRDNISFIDGDDFPTNLKNYLQIPLTNV